MGVNFSIETGIAFDAEQPDRFSTDGRSAEQSSVSGQIGQFWTAERPSP
jgi:hypothetical protein